MTLLSPVAEKEFQELTRSESFRNDMEAVRLGRLHAFVKDGVVDVDAYIDFVTQFNEFIGHEPKPFRTDRRQGHAAQVDRINKFRANVRYTLYSVAAISVMMILILLIRNKIRPKSRS